MLICRFFKMSSLLMLTAALTFAVSCKKKDSDDDDDGDDDAATDQLEVGAIEDVKGITDPVIEFASGDTSTAAVAAANFDSLAIDDAAFTATTATTGVSIGSSTADIKAAFGSSGSKAYCETVNQGMKFFFNVGAVDWSQCVLKKLLKSQKGIYDGKEHILSMSGKVEMDGETMEEHNRFKFKFTAKDEKLTGFEAWVCKGDGKGNYTQDQYQVQTIEDNTLTLSSISVDQDSETAISTEMTAPLDSDGNFVGIKQIIYKEAATGDDGRFVEAEVAHSANHIRYVGYENSNGSVSEFYSFAEFIDNHSTSDLHGVTKLAYGSGAALVKNSGTTYNKGWNGDTLAVDAASSYKTKTDGHAADLTSSSTAPDIAFSKAQTYDCEGEDTVEVEAMDEDDMMACFEAFYIDQDGSGMCNNLTYQ
jgi:hypothetical protein